MSIYAISTPNGEQGDCFYGTIEQFSDCFASGVETDEQLIDTAVALFGDDVIVEKIEA